MPKISQSEVRKKDYYVVRDIRSTDVQKVVFPNGLEVGLSEFRENAKSTFYNDMTVSGSILINPDEKGQRGYLQLNPGNGSGSINTNITASYVYTSGSTNDIYFTQVDGPFTNTTRLRWVESTLSTGLLHGGRLSTQNGTTTFSVEAGHGLIVDFNSSYTDEPKPVVRDLMWNTFVSQSLLYSASYQITYIAIDSSGSVFQSVSPFADGDFDNKIVLGRILHQAGSVTNGAITAPVVSYARSNNMIQFIKAFGPLKISGHVLTSPSSNLGVIRSAGESYVVGRNYTVNSDSPDYVNSSTDVAMVTPKIFREYWTGGYANLTIDTNTNAGYTAIDPTQYNPGGTGLSAVSAASKFTIQRVYWFPNSVNKALHIYYGVAEYNSIADAQAAVGLENFIESPYTSTEAIYLGYIVVKKTCTDLNNAADAKIVLAGISRAAGGTGGGTAAAPQDAAYVTLSTDPSLTNERLLTAGAGLTLTDGGAGSTVTLDVGAGTDITVNANDIQVNRATLATAFAGNGLSDAGSSLAVNPGSGIKIVTDAVTIDNSVVATVSGTSFTGDVIAAKSLDIGNRSLSPGGSVATGTLVVRGGPNAPALIGAGSQTIHLFGTGSNGSGGGIVFGDYSATYGVGIFEDTDDTLLLRASGRINVYSSNNVGINKSTPTATLHVGGNAKFDSGLSGSLTNLADGTSYLVAGSNIAISSGTNGSVTIASTVSQSTGTFNDVSSKLSTTGTFAVAGNLGFGYFANNVGTDINFFVSGSTKSIGTATRGSANFGGDIIVSGSVRSLEMDESLVLALQVFG